MKRLLIANRGEIAIRIIRAAGEMGIRTVAVCSEDDKQSLHTKLADKSVVLKGNGVAPYLDIEQILGVAKYETCEAIHPGYGFLSENVAFARRCAEENVVFIGPTVTNLQLFGNKIESRVLARHCGVPLLPGTDGPTSLAEAMAFFDASSSGSAVLIKALAGGGGRGIRTVDDKDDLEEAYNRCRSEALAAFGNGDVFVEKKVLRPRHVEIQIIGDGTRVCHLWERECTLQRHNQKLVEIAPSPGLSASLRDKLIQAALKMAKESNYLSLGTFEFLIDETAEREEEAYTFMEVNPRIQVEHTVTEEVMDVDLVKIQLEIAAGRTLADLNLLKEGTPRGHAMQLRINMETMDEKGTVIPESGTLSTYEIPSGRGVRVDGYGYNGYATNPVFDSLLAKLIVHSSDPTYAHVVRKAYNALSEFKINGVATNIPFLQNLLSHPEVVSNEIDTSFIDTQAAELVSAETSHPNRYFKTQVENEPARQTGLVQSVPPGTIPVLAGMKGSIVEILVNIGDAVAKGQKLAIMEAMKMEHLITAVCSGYIEEIRISRGGIIEKGGILFAVREAEVSENTLIAEEAPDLDTIRPDLAAVIEAHSFTLDENRPDAVERRRQKNRRTARANIDDLVDTGSFREYGALTYAAQKRRHPVEDLVRKTPADGFIAGLGKVNNHLFGEKKARCMVMAYDYTVLAGTQGMNGHKKLDRVIEVAGELKLPVVLFAEGAGGRPGDTDTDMVAGLDLLSFTRFAALSGKAPLIGILEGPCFAGNACLLGFCDVIIATEHANIGMGGPAMIEGGGLGIVSVEEIGPIDVQTKNGVVDVAVANEAEAVSVAKKYLSYFQGALSEWEAEDQRKLRFLIPENRLRVYDIRNVIETLADRDSVLELKRQFGPGIVTAFIRIEGHPFGLITNDPAFESGAIEAEGADKASRFMRLCNVHGLPILSLCDTPGFMVGPEVEERAHVRHCCQMFIQGANLKVPFFGVVLRKGYGLGAMSMLCGSFHNPVFTIAWPSGEFGGMGLEAGVRLALKKELAAIENLDEREKTYQMFVDEAYKMGKATNMAAHLEIDAVIDPAETRQWIISGLDATDENKHDS